MLDIHYYLYILNEESILMIFTLMEEGENVSQGRKNQQKKNRFSQMDETIYGENYKQ